MGGCKCSGVIVVCVGVCLAPSFYLLGSLRFFCSFPSFSSVKRLLYRVCLACSLRADRTRRAADSPLPAAPVRARCHVSATCREAHMRSEGRCRACRVATKRGLLLHGARFGASAPA